MNLKKKFREFFTLTRNNGGFTLVELIVVIAILAILAGIGVPAYSGYVTKANMAADQALVREVANALTLQYYADVENAAAGYVVLTTSAASTDGAFAALAMENTFGSDWNDVLKLKYANWNDSGLMSLIVSNTQADAQDIAAGTILQSSNPASLMSAVTDVTGLVSNKVLKTNNAKNKLTQLLGSGNPISAMVENLDENSEEFANTISNMLVGYMADMMQTSQDDTPTLESQKLTELMTVYAGMYSYVSQSNNEEDQELLEQMQTNISKLSMDDLTNANVSVSDLLDKCFDNSSKGGVAMDEEKLENYYTFMDTNGDKDQLALTKMMGAVSQIAGTYADDNKALADANLYSSSSVEEQITNYVNAINAVATMSAESYENLKNMGSLDGNVVIFIGADGAVSVVPSAAYLAG